MHDEADSIGLDAVAEEELAHVVGCRLKRDALHLQDALATKAQRQSGLHLLAGHLQIDTGTREELAAIQLQCAG